MEQRRSSAQEEDPDMPLNYNKMIGVLKMMGFLPLKNQ
jgi:hypothetical protein